MRKTCLLKVLAITVISAMCAPFVTACNNEQKDDRTTVPTHAEATAGVPDIEEPNQTAETLPSETSESEAETAAPDGMYTYTLYEGTPNEMKISMHCMCSRDDAIVIAYGLWFFANNTDDNSGFKDTFSNFTGPNGNMLL